MTTLEDLVSGAFGQTLKLHAEQKLRHCEEVQELLRIAPLTVGESMIFASAATSQMHKLPDGAPSPTKAGVQAGRAMFTVFNERVDEAASALDPGRQMLGKMAAQLLAGFGPILESVENAADRELDGAEIDALRAAAGGMLDQIGDFFSAPAEIILMPHKGALAKKAKNPKARAQAAAMAAIKDEWLKRKRAGMKINATAFAKEMATKHENIVTPEHLKNQQTEWNKTYHPAS